MASLDYALDLMKLDSRFEGRRLKGPPRLCMKALALKEICKASLIYAESLFRMYLGVKIPKSTLHYWEVRHGDAVEDALKALNLLRNRPAGGERLASIFLVSIACA
jgi:DNA-binding transcriptional regulator YiaG